MKTLTKEQVEGLKGCDNWSHHQVDLIDTALTLHAKLEKAEAERDNAEAAFEAKCDLLTKREAELAELREKVAAIRRSDTGAWMSTADVGHKKRIELMNLLENLYKAGGADV